MCPQSQINVRFLDPTTHQYQSPQAQSSQVTNLHQDFQNPLRSLTFQNWYLNRQHQYLFPGRDLQCATATPAPDQRAVESLQCLVYRYR